MYDATVSDAVEENSLRQALYVIQEFHKISTSQINVDKTEVTTWGWGDSGATVCQDLDLTLITQTITELNIRD